MTLLITGATGYIGRHLTARLTADGVSVLALMRDTERLPALRRDIEALGGNGIRVEAVQGDLSHPGLGLTGSLPNLSGIVHLGARFDWNLTPEDARTTNVQGSLEVAALAQRLQCRLIYVSGFMLENRHHLERLGIDADAPETTHWDRVYRRVGAYEASKLESALAVRAFAGRTTMDWVEVQPGTVSGHSVTGDLDMAQPLYTLIDNLARGRMALVPGSPRHWLPLIPVDALTAILEAAVRAVTPPARLLALDPATPNLRPLFARLAKQLQRRAPTHHLPMPLLAALLRVPGLPGLLNTAPEALHFIQPVRFDTSALQRFANEQSLRLPNVAESIDASARRYRQDNEAS